MDLSTLQNSKTTETINLASDSSAASPARIVTSSPKDFMNKLPRAKKHIDNVVKRIKATNQAREEKSTDINEPDKDTDYANIITIKKADPQQTKPHENNSTQQSTITPQPQHSSTPIHQNNSQHQQTAEHDSTYDIENEQQTHTYTATKQK